MALSKKGRFFVWGNNYYGQLGIGVFGRIINGRDSTISAILIPQEITSNFRLELNDKINSLSINGQTSSALSLNGRVFTWGNNNASKIGNGSNAESAYPNEITSNFNLFSNEKINQLSMGYDHVSAISNFGRMFIWGYYFYGQDINYAGMISKSIPTLVN
jgi:alpha-tubulin suppressor-like RCC1 family protein